MQKRVLGWPRAVKRLVVVGLDVVMALAATWLAFTLRLDELHWPTGAQWWVYAPTPTLAVPVFIRFGLYRAFFRYTGQAALLATAQGPPVCKLLLHLVCLGNICCWGSRMTTAPKWGAASTACRCLPRQMFQKWWCSMA